MKSPLKPSDNHTIQYADIGFRMMAIIIVFVLLGIWLDSTFPQVSPLFTAGLSIFSVFAAMYIAMKGLIQKK